MKTDSYYKEDSNGYLVTYSGSTTGTIKENLYTYLNNLKTNTASIICRNLFTNSHGLCPNETKSNGEKSNGRWSYGQSYNSGGHRPGDNIVAALVLILTKETVLTLIRHMIMARVATLLK